MQINGLTHSNPLTPTLSREEREHLRQPAEGEGSVSTVIPATETKNSPDFAWTLADIPAEDPAVYRMLQQADSIGVFQVESRAQMTMLPRLKPANYYDLVIEIAIVRPGPIQGEMVHPYLARRQGLEAVDYPSPEVKAVLERTLGIPIFQEQVMQLAMVAAGFTADEADQLRRAMAAWKRKGGLEPFERKLLEGMRARGYSAEFAQRIFQQIKGFGDYGFPESHSASFALLAYVSAWLKCHHPAAFCCALLNSQPMGFYGPSQLVQDARRHGVEVRPVDVQTSLLECSLEFAAAAAPALRLGFNQVKSLAPAAANAIVQARQQGRFAGIADLAARAGLNRQDLEHLAAADALQPLAGNRHHAFWAAGGTEAPTPMFGVPALTEATPLLKPPSLGQDVLADYASTVDLAQPSIGVVARPPAPPRRNDGGIAMATPQRQHRPGRRPGDLPTTAYDRVRRNLCDFGRRNRPGQSGGLAGHGFSPTQTAPESTPTIGNRHDPTGRRRIASDSRQTGGLEQLDRRFGD